jgi:hypothetical protein
MDEFGLFRMMYPEKYIIDTVIPATNKGLEGPPLTVGEFYRWLGIQLFMACYQGISDRTLWWSSKKIDKYEGAPFRMNKHMSSTRFEAITAALRLTDRDYPTDFEDKFHEVRQCIAAFNDHYSDNYNPSWLNCLDESMNVWLDKYCPGFMVVPRKPHPCGNEYHTICDGDDKRPILWRMELVEGKDRPKRGGQWAFPCKFESAGITKTPALMLRMTEPIHGQGKVVTMDSGFCVAKGVTEMKKRGVYGQAIVKKRKFWPKFVPGDHIIDHFKTAALGTTETYKQTLDGEEFLVHCYRDDKYVCKMMSCHGLLDEVPDHKTARKVNGQWKSFCYAEPFSRHNNGKHWVDDHNNRRHDPISLDDTWKTKWWPMRQFTFTIGVAEVNANNARARGRKREAEPQLEFRKKLAKLMIENTLDGSTEAAGMNLRDRTSNNGVIHRLTQRGNFEGAWDNGLQAFSRTKQKYQKSSCDKCGTKCRTYCACNRSVCLCVECYADHKPTVETSISGEN